MFRAPILKPFCLFYFPILLWALLLPAFLVAQTNPCEVGRIYIPNFKAKTDAKKIEPDMVAELTSYCKDQLLDASIKNKKLGFLTLGDDYREQVVRLRDIFCNDYDICEPLKTPIQANLILAGLIHFYKNTDKVQIELQVFSIDQNEIIGFGKSNKMDFEAFKVESNRTKLIKEAYETCFPNGKVKPLLNMLAAPCACVPQVNPDFGKHFIPGLHPLKECRVGESIGLITANAASWGIMTYYITDYYHHRRKRDNALSLSEKNRYEDKMRQDRRRALGFGLGGYALVFIADLIIHPKKARNTSLRFQGDRHGLGISFTQAF